MKNRYKLLAGTALLLCSSLPAQEEADRISDQNLQYQSGRVVLDGEIATVTVPEGFKFLDAKQSRTVLEDMWGNPPDESILGMLFKKNESPLSDNFSYAVTVSFSEDGYVKDDEAKEIDYDELLQSMKDDEEGDNKERTEEGYPPIRLIGWASPPFYDAETKKLHWAKNLKFGDEEINTLNYNIRMLGRKGVLVLNVISDMNQIEAVKRDVPTILASTEFNEGHRYADFNPGIDTVAAYGIGALIAGKVFAKAGLFVLLAKFWKLIAIGVVAFGGMLRKLFSGNKDVAETSGEGEA